MRTHRWQDPDAPPVAEVGDRLTPLQGVEMAFLMRVVAPVKQRLHKREPLPPPLPGKEVARRLFELPVKYWTYDFEPGVRHLGPMAQDFAAAFGLGASNRKIAMVDANGVNTVAIQVLHRRLAKLEAEVVELRAQLAARPAPPD